MRVDWHPEQITAQIELAAMDGLEEAAKTIASIARSLVPTGRNIPQGKGKWSARESGALKKSIRVTRLRGDAKQNIRVYAGSEKVYYAGWVEYGSVHNDNPHRPFLRPALEMVKSKVAGIVEGKIGASIGSTPPSSSGGWGDVLNWKPDPGRSSYLDSFGKR